MIWLDGQRCWVGRLRALPLFLCLLWSLFGLARVEARSHKKAKPAASQEDPAARSPAPTAAPASPAAPSPASAAAPSASSPAAGSGASQSQDPCLSDPKCNELYERARALSKAGQYDAALVLYQQTFAMRPLPWLLLNVGRMQQKLSRHEQALVTYRKILDWNAKQPADDQSNLADDEVLAKSREYRQQAEDALAEQRRQNPSLAAQTGPAVDKTPLYKKWWFWTIVGGTVAAVAVGVGLGVGLSATTSPGTARVPAGVPVLTPSF